MNTAWMLVLALFCQSSTAAISGNLRASVDQYAERLGEPTDPLIPYALLDFNGKHKFNKRLRVQFKGLGFANMESQSSPEKIYGDLPEAFIQWKPRWAEFRLGMNTLNWGVVDGFSPSDVVNTQVFLHPLRTFKRGAPMVEAQFGGESLNAHLVYIPRQRRALLPSTDSRWLPRELLVNIEAENRRIVLPDFMNYEYLSDETLSNALDHNAGIRFKSNVGSWDFQVTHFEGAAPNPKVRPTIEFDLGSGNEVVARSPVRLAPVMYRVRTTGFGMVWARERWIYRAETAYQHTISEDDLLQPWSWTSVVAAETNLELGSSTAMVLMQYYHTENPQAPDNLISSTYRLFDRTAVLGARWAVSDELTINLSSLFETRTQGLFAMLGFEHKLSDATKWAVSWRDFSAAEDGLIKTFDRNDHACLELTYYF